MMLEALRAGRLAASATALLLIAGPVLPTGPAAADELLDGRILGPRIAQNNASARSQQRVDQLANQAEDDLIALRRERETIKNLQSYNKRLFDLIKAQEEEERKIQKQIDGVTGIERGILPLMDRMVDALDAFVKADLPFRATERSERIENLRELMQRADVTSAEKYRRLMEAYGIEAEAGRTIDAYTDKLEDGRLVEFLQIGRILLVYQTQDGDETARWDNVKREWVPLDSSYRASIAQGLRIARKQAAPDLLTLPVAGPESATRRTQEMN